MYFYKNKILTHNDSIWVRIRRDKNVKNNNFFRISKKEGNSIIWKEVINHIIIIWEEVINYRKYIEADLKWCIGYEI